MMLNEEGLMGAAQKMVIELANHGKAGAKR